MKPSLAATCLPSLLAVCMAFATSTTLAASEIYCWKDDSGQRQCGDHIPPQYSDRDRAVIGESGHTIKVLPHAKTEAELAADAKAEQDKKAEAEQHRYDQYLLSTFESTDDLKKMRDERLAVLDGNIRITELSSQNTENSLAELRARKERIKGNGRTPPAELDQQIRDYEARLASDRKGIETRKQERQALSAKFDRDIARFRSLKGEAGAAATTTN
jgi:hypothetical protein